MINFDFKPDRIKEKCRKWDYELIKEKYGNIPKDFIPMWIADMDFKIPKELEEKLLSTINTGVFGYTYCYDEFYKAVINWQKDIHNVAVNKDEIILTYGTVSTLHYVVQAFCKENDNIILNTPIYSPFEDCAKKQGVNVICNSLKILNNRYYIDFEDLENKIIKYKPKLMLFCSPHNPSGRIWSFEEITKVAEICNMHNVILVSDEVHSEHIHIGKHYSILSLENTLLNNVILLTSPNKAFNLGGLKTSYAIIKNKDLFLKFKNQLNKNSITSPNVFGIISLITVYNDCRNWLNNVNSYIFENYLILKNWIDKTSLLSMMEMEASYLPWINIKNTNLNSKEFCLKLAQQKGVILEPGANFVKDGNYHIRLNLGTQKENVLAAIEKIDEFLK